MKTYKYIGDGAGVPGLPHSLTEDEAAALPPALAEQFKSTLEAGLYQITSTDALSGASRQASADEAPKRKSKKADEIAAEGD